MNREDIVVRIINLPTTIKGFCSPSPDGTYNVYLNARQSCETQDKTFKHEIEHIEQGHFDSDKPVTVLEKDSK